MQIIGLILLWGGFLGAALASVWRLEIVDAKWSTIPWTYYGLSMAAGVSGVILLRWANRPSSEHAAEVAGSYATLTTSLDTLVAKVSELRGMVSTGQPRAVVEFIDTHCTAPFADFVDARNAITKTYGLKAFADVMGPFSSGERFVNRAWSAAADGYLEEAGKSLQTAETCLRRANETLRGLGE